MMTRGQAMKEYPSIPAAGHLLARSANDYLGRPFIAFDKLDGSNIRAEWDRKRGWHGFGSRRRLLDPSQPLLGRSGELILDSYGDGLARVFTEDPTFGRPQQATAYFEFLGPHSFAGQHDPKVLGVESNEPFRVMLIDVNIHKRGLVSAEEFVERFGHLGIPRVIRRGVLDREFIADVRANRFETPEGVILKGGEGHQRWMAKVKTTAYFHRLKTFFQDDWHRHWE
jgi:hypothetical protein